MEAQVDKREWGSDFGSYDKQLIHPVYTKLNDR